MKTSEVLTAARALINAAEKWGQRENAFGKGRRCAGSAICDAVPCYADSSAAFEAFEAIIKQPIVRWQDAPERTHAEVMAAFDRAIAAAQADEARP